MRRVSLVLCLLVACSPVAIYRGTINQIRGWQNAEEARAETNDLTGMGLRAEFTYDKPALTEKQQGCAALMSQQYQEADACEGELQEMGDGCKIPGACPKCEAMVQTVAQYKADGCVI
jgi:hypothetical protein